MTTETIYAIILSVFISVLPSLLMLVYIYGKRAGYRIAVDDYNKIFNKEDEDSKENSFIRIIEADRPD